MFNVIKQKSHYSVSNHIRFAKCTDYAKERSQEQWTLHKTSHKKSTPMSIFAHKQITTLHKSRWEVEKISATSIWFFFCGNVFNVFNPFPLDIILDQDKLRAFAEDKLNVTKMNISVFDRIENIVGKGEIACSSKFSFSHNVFKRLLSQTRQKVSLCGNELNRKDRRAWVLELTAMG